MEVDPERSEDAAYRLNMYASLDEWRLVRESRDDYLETMQARLRDRDEAAG
jgi:hypothetical protein